MDKSEKRNILDARKKGERTVEGDSSIYNAAGPIQFARKHSIKPPGN